MRFFFLVMLFEINFLGSQESLKYTCLKVPNSSYLRFITRSQFVHVLEVDPSLYEIKPIKALDDGIGRESVLSISSRYGALASVNGGFFSIGGTLDGKACGTLKIQDWYALPFKPRGCIGWSINNQKPLFDRLLVKIEALYEQTSVSLDGLNRARKDGEMILFTPCFHRTTLTNPDGEELIVKEGIIQKIRRRGSCEIPENGFIVSIQCTHPLFGTFQIGQSFTLQTQIDSLIEKDLLHDWNRLDYIVGGTPILIYQGEKMKDFQQEETLSSFLHQKHARTAVGVLPNGNWIFVVVDKMNLFDGMTIDELCDFMKQLGCLYALNLDGGGSSTMVYQGNIKNTPYGDKEEGNGQKTVRLVSDAILVLEKKAK